MDKQTKWNESFKAGRDYNPLNIILLDSIFSFLTNQPETAIDLGCGTGDTVIKIAQKGIKVTGVDWSQDALDKAQTKADAIKLNEVTFMQGDLNKLSSLTLEKADLIFCKLVIAFIKDRLSFLQEIKKCLNPGGVFVLQTPVLYDNISYLEEDKPHIAVNYKQLHELLTQTFSNVEEFNHSFYGERGDLVTYIIK